MFIQFDGGITDLSGFENGLHLMGLYPLSVRLSRWVRTDPDTLQESDAGPRIDIELLHEAGPFAAPKVAAIQQYVAVSPFVLRAASLS